MPLRQEVLEYPYLFSNLLLLSVILLAVRAFPLRAHRRLIIRLGLVMTAFFPFAAVSEGLYWSPARVAGGAFGIEDALCAFNIGALGALPAVMLFRESLQLEAQPKPGYRRLGVLAALTLLAFSLLRVWGCSVMAATVLMQLAVWAGLLLLRRDLWRFWVLNSVAVGLLHFVVLKALFWVWPDFVSAWSGAAPWGMLVAGVPLGELVWAFSFGALWPVFGGYVFDLRLAGRRVEAAVTADTEMELTA